MAPFLDTSKPEGRPDVIERPARWGSSLHAVDDGNPGRARDNRKHEVRLPPGMNRAQFDKALHDLRGLLGPDFVELNEGSRGDGDYYHLAKSHDPYSPIDKDYFVPSAVVYPGDTADVQIVVKWANKWRIPIWPCSVGRNLGYGGASPRVPGSVMLDLGKRMNRVLNVDERSASCIVEPGVTYIDLYEELKRRGLGDKIWIDVPDLGGGSVLGNACQRGVGYTSMGDHWGNHCGMEVVLPNGEIMRTGTDAMPNSKTGQVYPHAFGPSVDGLFSQSNMGIITRMGMWLMPNPGGIRVFQIVFKRLSDLAPAIEILRPLMLNRVFGNVPSMRIGLWDAATYKSKAEMWPEHNGRIIPPEIVERITTESGSGAWCMYSCLYGPDEVTAPTYEYVKKQFSAIPDVKFNERSDVPDNAYLHDRAKVFAGVPTFRELEYLKFHGANTGELWFAPISPVSGDDAVAQVELCKKLCYQYGFDYLGTYYIAAREMHHIVGILFDRSNEDERRRATELNRALIAEFAKLGYGEYRTHLAFHDQVCDTFNWADPSASPEWAGGALKKFNEILKDAIDVNGILQPGASGIWPKQYRQQGGWALDGKSKPKDTRNETVERL